MENKYEVTRRLREAEGNLAYNLDVFGDTLASREGYKSVDGLEALQYFLMQRHGWLPKDVRSMSIMICASLLRRR
jgi:hypothetical protein